MNELQQMLATLATKEQVIDALGLKEEQSEEFFQAQIYTVKNRFLSYLLFKHKADMTLVAGGYDYYLMMDMATTAEELLANGLQYKTIRNWWRTQGVYLHNRAFNAKREKEMIDQMFIAVLVFFPKGRPLYLQYEHGEVRFTENDPFKFPIMSISDLDRGNLAKNAEDFAIMVQEYGAIHVKLLPKKVQS